MRAVGPVSLMRGMLQAHCRGLFPPRLLGGRFPVPRVSCTGLLVVALVSQAEASERARPSCEAGDVHLELEEDAPGGTAVLCMRPGVSTSFFFDAKLARVVLEGREHFQRVMEAPEGLAVVPSESMHDVQPLRLTVYFVDGAAPASANFLLMMHPALAARQVDVIRHTRPAAFYEQQKREAEARAQRCEEEQERLRAELGGPGGLWGMRKAGLLDNILGVRVRDIPISASKNPVGVLAAIKGWTYRTQDRVAVEVVLENLGTQPWTVAGAALRASNGEELTPLPLGLPVSIQPGRSGEPIMVEVDAKMAQALGTHSFTLWGEDGRSVTLENVTFP